MSKPAFALLAFFVVGLGCLLCLAAGFAIEAILWAFFSHSPVCGSGAGMLMALVHFPVAQFLKAFWPDLSESSFQQAMFISQSLIWGVMLVPEWICTAATAWAVGAFFLRRPRPSEQTPSASSARHAPRQ
ncbi:MAG: hypothetical protein FJ288_11015 [Planctomycetes bacterium]|nr:hypothetical protein [Planctomycetota bacterium]